jgi:preprotein translocase subunit SecG
MGGDIIGSGPRNNGGSARWRCSVKNFLTNVFHVLGILFFILILYIILSISGFFAAFGAAINAGH